MIQKVYRILCKIPSVHGQVQKKYIHKQTSLITYVISLISASLISLIKKEKLLYKKVMPIFIQLAQALIKTVLKSYDENLFLQLGPFQGHP